MPKIAKRFFHYLLHFLGVCQQDKSKLTSVEMVKMIKQLSIGSLFWLLCTTARAQQQEAAAASSSFTRSNHKDALLQGATPWTDATHFPLPHVQPEQCRASSSLRACDPDAVFPKDDWDAIDELLAKTNPTLPIPCRRGDDSDAVVAVQMAVAVTRKLDLRPFRNYQDPSSSAAQAFARGVHDYWGVGVDTPCGGTGILLLVSDLDRTVYISVGLALQTTVLTDRRIDRVIQNMKPFFKRQQYKDAVVHAINEMVYLIHSGPPDLYERTVDFLAQYSGLLWMAVIFGFVFVNARRQRAQQRQYAAAAAHLDELERARAQALQGRFQMESCPICLEAFPKEQQEGQEGEEQQQQELANDHPTITTMGSDGQPIKLLRCGHCFDESCWAEWVNTGRGQVDKCPVCQQSVGRRSPPEEPQTTANTRRAQRTRTTTTTTEHSPQDARGETRSADASTDDMDDPTATTDMDPLLNNNNNNNSNAAQPQADEPLQLRALQRYQHERNFRLARLAVRYPRYITQQHVQRWTSSTYNGQMVRDPSFVQNDPSRQHHHHNAQQSTTTNGRSRTSRSSGGSSGSSRVSTFGGGISGGGRAGRW